MAPKKVRRKKKRTRRAPAVVSGRPLLTLAMMVKDEEDFLADALRSAKGWVDEMVVVDTGSTDRTVEIAKDFGAQVSFFAWCDSFSEARNVTLQRSTGRWIAVLDADERFRGAHPEAIRPHLKAGPNHPFEGLAVNVVNTRLDGSPISSFFSTRFFPNHERLGYRGRVHNSFGDVRGERVVDVTRYVGLEVVHLGYDPALYAARKKAARSLPLIEKTVQEDPENLQYRFYLGREYLLLERVDEAIEVLEPTVDALLRGEKGPLAEATVTLVRASNAAGRPREGQMSVLREALKRAPEHPDLWFCAGAALAAMGRPAEATEAIERALALLDRPIESVVELRHGAWAAHELLGELHWALQRFPESYRAYLAALEGKPAESPGWPKLLNAVCALAIELGDEAKKPALLDRLLAHPEAPPGMFFFEVERLVNAGQVDAARALLQAGRAKAPRLEAAAEYRAVAARLGVGE